MSQVNCLNLRNLDSKKTDYKLAGYLEGDLSICNEDNSTPN